MGDFTGSPPIDAKLTGAAHPPVLLAGAIGGNDNNDDDGPVWVVVRVGDCIVAASALLFLIPALVAYKRKLLLECWALICFVVVHLMSDACELSLDWCLVETDSCAAWARALGYLLVLDATYLYCGISIYHRAPLVLAEVTLLILAYQALVLQRSIGSEVILDALVFVIAKATAFEKWLSKKLFRKFEGDIAETDEDEDSKPSRPPNRGKGHKNTGNEEEKSDASAKEDGSGSKDNDDGWGMGWFTADTSTLALLFTMSGALYLLMLLFPPQDKDPGGTEKQSDGALLVHAMLHTAWHFLVSGTASLMLTTLHEIPYSPALD